MSYLVDKVFNKILDEAEEHFKGRVTRVEIKDLYYKFWHNIRILMKSKKVPVILIPKFGRLFPKITKLEKVKDWREPDPDMLEAAIRIRKEIEARKRNNQKK